MAGVNVYVNGDASKAERELSSFERKTRKIAKSIQKGFQERIGHKLFDGLTSAARAVPGMLNDAIDSASSLNEALGKSEIIFGDSARSIEKWSETTAESLGIAKGDAIAAAGSFGAIFKALGFGQKDMAEMSRTLVNLAADMGSVNDVANDEVITALLAAMRGESEPISRLGVNFREATLQAKAFEMGLHDGKGALDAQTKAIAAYNVILEQTSWQQGNFSDTSDDLANSKKILTARFKEAQTEIGNALLPAMKSLVDLMGEIDWKDIAKDIGTAAEMFITLAGNVGDAYNSFKSFSEELMITLGILKDIKKEIPDMSRFAGEFEPPPKTEKDARFDRGTKAIMDAAERDKAKALAKNEIAQAQKVTETKKKLLEEEEEKRKKIAEITRDEFKNLSMREAEALAGLGMDGVLKNARKQELLGRKISEKDATEISEREETLRRLDKTRDLLDRLSGIRSNAAVSSMQSIGGGGGVAVIDIQKRQADLQQQMVKLLEKIKGQKPMESISDF